MTNSLTESRSSDALGVSIIASLRILQRSPVINKMVAQAYRPLLAPPLPPAVIILFSSCHPLR